MTPLNTVAKKIAAGGVGAGMLLAGWGLASSDTSESVNAAPSAVVSGVGDIETVDSLRPIEDVVALFERRSQENPTDYVSRTQWGAALAAQAREEADLDRYAEAEQVLRDALETNPIYPQTRLVLASTLSSQHKFDDALTLAEDLHAEDPTILGALAVMGDAAFELGDYDRAAGLFRELSAVEYSPPVVSRLAKLEFSLGRPEAALALAEDALSAAEQLVLRPSNEAFYLFQVGHYRFETGDVSGAVEALEAALEIEPQHGGAAEKLAGIYAADGQIDEAIALYQGLIATGPAPDLYGSLATLLAHQGDTAAAAEQVEIGLALAEETMDQHPAERRHLVGFLVDHDPATALALAEQDFAERRDIHAYDTLAWALYANGDVARAAELIDEALAFGSKEAVLEYHAGVIHAAAGNTDTATAHLAAALEINDRFAFNDADHARQLLAELTS